MSVAGVVIVFLAVMAIAVSLRWADTMARWDDEINRDARRESERKRNH